MTKFVVQAPIIGQAYVIVEARSKEEAIEIAKKQGEWTLNDWDINTQPHNGGYIDVEVDD